MTTYTCITCRAVPVYYSGHECPGCRTARAIEKQNRLIAQQQRDNERDERQEQYLRDVAEVRRTNPEYEPSLGSEAPLVFNDGSYNWGGIIYSGVVLSGLFIFFRGAYRFWIGV